MKSPILVGLGVLFSLGAVVHLALAHGQGGHASPHGHDSEELPESFEAGHVRKQASILLHGGMDRVWPLFDPINESKWAAAWDPRILFPANRTVQEGMVLRVHGTTWVVTRYDAENHHITYTVSHPEKVFMIDVQCESPRPDITKATVTYDYVGLSETGNELIQASSKRMFANDLKDWQRMINHYLETGETLPPEETHGDHASHGHNGHGQH